MNKSGLVPFLALLISNSITFQLKAQTQNVPQLQDVVKVPTSPEATAFAKFGNTPPNLYSGTPSISVPLATLKGREIEVPISLSYDATGIKVEQISTWVGLGWNLNVGGMVTRQVNGWPDDYSYAVPAYSPFYTPQAISDYTFMQGFTPVMNSIYSPGQLETYFNALLRMTRTDSNDKLEIHPDTYSFNVLGLSGTVFIDYTTNT